MSWWSSVEELLLSMHKSLSSLYSGPSPCSPSHVSSLAAGHWAVFSPILAVLNNAAVLVQTFIWTLVFKFRGLCTQVIWQLSPEELWSQFPPWLLENAVSLCVDNACYCLVLSPAIAINRLLQSLECWGFQSCTTMATLRLVVLICIPLVLGTVLCTYWTLCIFGEMSVHTLCLIWDWAI